MTAVFLPASKHTDTLLRYDLLYNSITGFSRESITDIARYNRLLSLNRSELGYLIKCVSAEESSNLFQGEHKSDLLFGDLVLETYRNFLKVIIKRLGFKINKVILRHTKVAFRGVWDIL